MGIITTTAEHGFDREGTEMGETEAKETAPGKVFLRLSQRATRDHEWLRERTERLLPEVTRFIERYRPLPATWEIVLTSNWRMAFELAWQDADGATGLIGRFRQLRAVRDWRGLGAALRDWPSRKTPGGRQVVIYLDVEDSRLRDEIEWGALLAEQLMLAALTASPNRARHLGSADELVDTTLPLSPRLDLRYSRVGLEFAAASAAGQAWRRHRSGLRNLLARADDVLELLDAHCVDRPEAVIRECYTEFEVPEMTTADVKGIATWVSERGTELYMSSAVTDYERARRLQAAAWCDLLALMAEAEGSERAPELASTAVLLGWGLRDFDAQHSTGCGQHGPEDLYWEASGLARAYTRQEWLACAGVDPDDED